jgi:hypothetical protein
MSSVYKRWTPVTHYSLSLSLCEEKHKQQQNSPSLSMDELSEVHDWDLPQSTGSPLKSMKELDSPRLDYESDAGAVKPDYFSLDSGAKYTNRAPSEDEDSDNPSWVDPEFFPMNQPREFWSDESNYTENREIGQLNGERLDPFDWESETRDSVSEDEKKQIEKRWDAWWKFPFEMIKLCVCRIRPVWSFSVAAAILGAVILGRKLLKSGEQYKSTAPMPLKTVLDEKVNLSLFPLELDHLNFMSCCFDSYS